MTSRVLFRSHVDGLSDKVISENRRKFVAFFLDFLSIKIPRFRLSFDARLSTLGGNWSPNSDRCKVPTNIIDLWVNLISRDILYLRDVRVHIDEIFAIDPG